ncbi:hypothetical protein NDU88_006436 [Pleurodeles waltl]|uniref:Uncharacterized protein n=1 Tax=Pleurodeles waltl TaxID=8319 RepID=A0AAV7NRX7_PLEWA|nr:hypothetical protein NDU88_006436 [Pleurodeles waltl]
MRISSTEVRRRDLTAGERFWKGQGEQGNTANKDISIHRAECRSESAKGSPATSEKGAEPTGAQILAAIESSSRATQTQIAAHGEPEHKEAPDVTVCTNSFASSRSCLLRSRLRVPSERTITRLPQPARWRLVLLRAAVCASSGPRGLPLLAPCGDSGGPVAVDVNLLRADLRVVAERSVATEQKVTCMQSDVDILKASVATLETQTCKLEVRVEDAEGRFRRCNLCVVGFPEGVEGANVEAFLED